MACPDEETVLGFVEGRLPRDQCDAFEQHVSDCGDCTELVAAAARLMDESSPAQAPTLPRVGAAPDPVAPLVTASGAQDLAAGVSVGRYVILQMVGRGGMGEVYAAYDPELDRKVAIKVIRETTHNLERPAARTRLLREARAIARLSHPNVVSVYDAGTIANRVFVAMEFVEGQTLADRLKALPGTSTAAGSGRMAPRERLRSILELFLAAGRGLAAAHAARIVHRDFKPQNVMVGADGKVRVMDFGLASAPLDDPKAPAPLTDQQGTETPAPASPLDPAATMLGGEPNLTHLMTVGLTRTGALLGTPAYMAPEQFQGAPAATRSDQFSFCVALYEALYGMRPFSSGTLPELIDSVLHGRVLPVPPNSAVPSWIRKILLRGLAVDPAERFAAMDDLLAALVADPVRRRRRVLAVAFGAAAFVGAAAMAGLLAERTHARAQTTCAEDGPNMAEVWDTPGRGGDGHGVAAGTASRREQVHQAFLATKRPFAADTWQRTAAILDQYASRWRDLYRDACQATHVRGEQSEESLDLRMTCLDERLRDVKTLTDLFAAADAEMVVGATDAARALPDLRRCSDLKALRTGVPPPHDAATSAKVEAVRRELAELHILKDAGRARAAVNRGRAALATARSIDYPPILAEALETMMAVQNRAGDFVEVERTAQEALWLALGAHLDEIALDAAQTMHETVGFALVRFDEAEVWSALTESLLRRVGAGHDKQWSWLWNDRGIILLKRGRFSEAEQELQKALKLKEQLLGSEHPDVGLTLGSLAAMWLEVGDYGKALQAADGTMERFTRAYGPTHPIVGRYLVNAAEARVGLGRFAEALAAYRRSLSLWETDVGGDSAMLGYPLTGIGVASLGLGDVQGAIGALERALTLREKSEVDPIPLAETRFALGRALWQKGDRSRALLLVGQARSAYARAPGLGRRLREVDSWSTTHSAAAAAATSRATASARQRP